MKIRLCTSLILVLGSLAASSMRADESSCHAAAGECEHQIRQMLAGRRYLGLQIVELKPGLMIKTVLPNSPASRVNLREGDRLYGVNGKSVRDANATQFKQLLAQAAASGRLWLIIQRRGSLRKVDLRLEPYPEDYIEKVISGHLAQSHTATAGAQP